jgi:DNA polymerase III epsilon subunit family exonuclease
MTIPSPGFRQKTLRLVRRLEEILLEKGALPPAEACRLLLHSHRVPPALAARILEDLVAGDRRFRLDLAGAVALAPAPAPSSLRLREARFTVLDLETTGGSPSSDRILEVGAVRVEKGRIDGSFTTLVNPGVPIPSFISSMTGIREEMVAGAPSFSAVAEELARFIGESVLVAHNLPFDLGFLNQELGRSCGFILANPSLCTVRLGRRLLPHLPDRRLVTLAGHYGMSFRGRHRALGDAEVTARLLLKFIVLLEEKGVEDLHSVERYLINGGRPPDPDWVSGGKRRRRQDSPPSSSGES